MNLFLNCLWNKIQIPWPVMHPESQHILSLALFPPFITLFQAKLYYSQFSVHIQAFAVFSYSVPTWMLPLSCHYHLLGIVQVSPLPESFPWSPTLRSYAFSDLNTKFIHASFTEFIFWLILYLHASLIFPAKIETLWGKVKYVCKCLISK